MSNRYFDMNEYYLRSISQPIGPKHYSQLRKANPKMQKYMQRVKEFPERVEDLTEMPKRIVGNNYFRFQVLMAQQASNYKREQERIISEINENRIPANRSILKRRRDYLEDMIKEYQPFTDFNKK